MTDTDAQRAYDLISQILSVYLADTSYCPTGLDRLLEIELTNPSHIGRIEMLRLDRIVNWRHKVWRSIREQGEIHAWEIPWKKRYMSRTEANALWNYYYDGRGWNWIVKKAIAKVYRNMSKIGLLDSV